MKISISVVILLAASACMAGTLYVDGSAPVAGDGSRNSPFKTITRATRASVRGDTILIKSGTYTENVAESDDKVLIRKWGPDRPVIRAAAAGEYAVSLSGYKARLVGIEVRGGRGLHLLGDYSIVRDCVFNGCVEPLRAAGHSVVIMSNEIRNSSREAPGGLFHVSGARNYIGKNYFHHNACPQAAAIFCQGIWTKLVDNLIFCDSENRLRFGIATSCAGEETRFTSCEDQEISYNRIWGYVTDAFIQIEGVRQDKTQILQNTLVGSKDQTAAGVRARSSAGSIGIRFNLVGNMAVGLDFEGSDRPDSDHNNFFSNKKDLRSVGAVALKAGVNDISRAPLFHSVDPDDPGFLHTLFSPVPVARTSGGGREQEGGDGFCGARPVYIPPVPGNVASGKPYLTWETKLGGVIQSLTDGYLGSRLYWRSRDHCYVLVDLGGVEPIDKILIHTSKYSLRSAEVSVSDDDLTYYRVGAAQNVLEGPEGPFVFRFEDLGTRGRYVHFKTGSAGLWPHISEIEVFRGAHDPRSARFGGAGFQRGEMSPADYIVFDRYHPSGRPLAIYRNHREELSSLKDNVARFRKVCRDPDKLKEIQARLTSLDRKLSVDGFEDRPEFHAEMTRINGDMPPALFGGRGGYILSESNPYEHLNTRDIPFDNTTDAAEVRIAACMNEVEPGAFLITSAVNEDINFTIDVSAPVSRKGNSIPVSQIEFRHPVEMAFSGTYASDALVKLDHGAGNRLVVPPGQTHQVWILVDTSGVAAGTYRGKITLSAGGFANKALALVVKVHPVKISSRTSLRTLPWVYAGSRRFRRNVRYSVRSLRSHKVNTVNEHSYVPWPEKGAFDEAGHLVKPINYSILDTLQDTFDKDYFDFYLFKMIFVYEDHRKLFQSDLVFGSERWQTALREWVNDWAMHMQKVRGMSTDQFALYPKDEPHSVGEMEDLIVRVGKTLRTADPKKYPYAQRVKVFVNPMEDMLLGSGFEQLKAADPYLGIICPAMSDYPQEILDDLHKLKSDIWGYDSSRRTRLPYHKKRLIWQCMKQGLTGVGFWVWAYLPTDTGRDLMYGFEEKVPGAGDEPIVPSRRWEAWRDGLDDYDLLERLRNLARAHPDKAAASKAMSVFNEAIEAVFAERENPKIALRQRERVIAEILKLDERRAVE